MLLLRLFLLLRFVFCVCERLFWGCFWPAVDVKRSVRLVLFYNDALETETLVVCKPRHIWREETSDALLSLVFSLYIINNYLTRVAVWGKQIFSNVYAPKEKKIIKMFAKYEEDNPESCGLCRKLYFGCWPLKCSHFCFIVIIIKQDNTTASFS